MVPTVLKPKKGAVTLSELLKGQQFCLLTTYRTDGTAVPTPMWYALHGETAYMYSKGKTGKVKRLRLQPKVTIGPCNGSGVPTGQQVEARARVLDDQAESATAESYLAARYGLKRRLLRWALRFSQDKTDAYLAVEL